MGLNGTKPGFFVNLCDQLRPAFRCSKCRWQLCWRCISARVQGNPSFYKDLVRDQKDESLMAGIHRFDEPCCKGELETGDGWNDRFQ